MKKFSLGVLFLFVALFSRAQETVAAEPQMADKFREDGKIYVVISVIAIVFISIVVFLMLLERRIKKMETKISSQSTS